MCVQSKRVCLFGLAQGVRNVRNCFGTRTMFAPKLGNLYTCKCMSLQPKTSQFLLTRVLVLLCPVFNRIGNDTTSDTTSSSNSN